MATAGPQLWGMALDIFIPSLVRICVLLSGVLMKLGV
jgi:hypothetical protein